MQKVETSVFRIYEESYYSAQITYSNESYCDPVNHFSLSIIDFWNNFRRWLVYSDAFAWSVRISLESLLDLSSAGASVLTNFVAVISLFFKDFDFHLRMWMFRCSGHLCCNIQKGKLKLAAEQQTNLHTQASIGMKKEGMHIHFLHKTMINKYMRCQPYQHIEL